MNRRLALFIHAASMLLLLAGGALLAVSGEQGARVAAAYTSETVKTSLVSSGESPDTPAGSGFTYQGRLKTGGSPASGQFDFSFSLFDALSGGSQVSVGVIEPNVTVQDGLFTVNLDFGATAFNGEGRWLQIAVRPADTGSYTTLTPRQPITPAPYALFALKTKGYENVVVVAKSGGDHTSIQGALDSITGNSGLNRYLVWVAPGTYSETVTMKPWVDIEGAGERQTVIISSGSVTDTVATVIGANSAALRSLSVINTGGAAYSIAIRNQSASPTLRNVTVGAGNATTQNIGVYNLSFTAPTMADMTIDVDGPDNAWNYGVYNNTYSTPSMSDMTILVSGWTNARNHGVYNHYYSSPTMTDLNIQVSGGDGVNGTSYSVAVESSSYSAPTITDITADVTGGEGNSYAIGVRSYDGASFTMSGGTITTRESTQNTGIEAIGYGSVSNMSGVSVSASGPVGSVNHGASAGSGTLNASDVRLTASGGYFASALLVSYGGLANLNGAVLRASGASDSNRTLFLYGGSAMVHASDIAAEGQSGLRYGVYKEYLNNSTSQLTLDSSKVKGATNSIYQSGGPLDYVRVAASKLEGGPVFVSAGGSTVTCAGVHDENYAFFTNSCP